MGDWKFPRWSAPFLGMGAGVIYAIRMRDPSVLAWIFGIGLCGLAGVFVFLLESKPSNPDAQKSNKLPSGIVGRFLAVSGCLYSIMPILGVILCAASMYVNKGTTDWAWISSIVGLIIACLSTFLILTGWDNEIIASLLERFLS